MSSTAAKVFQNIQVSPDFFMVDTPKPTLPPGYKPTTFDVLSGRGSSRFLHEGNRRFRKLIQAYLDRYRTSKSRTDKSRLVFEIVAAVRECGGHFLKREGQEWQDVGDKIAREKVGHALRDAKAANHQKKNNKKKSKKNTPKRNKDWTKKNQQQQELRNINVQSQTSCLSHQLDPFPMMHSSAAGILSPSDLDGFLETMVNLVADEKQYNHDNDNNSSNDNNNNNNIPAAQQQPTEDQSCYDLCWSNDLEPSFCYEALFRHFQ